MYKTLTLGRKCEIVVTGSSRVCWCWRRTIRCCRAWWSFAGGGASARRRSGWQRSWRCPPCAGESLSNRKCSSYRQHRKAPFWNKYCLHYLHWRKSENHLSLRLRSPQQLFPSWSFVCIGFCVEYPITHSHLNL